MPTPFPPTSTTQPPPTSNSGRDYPTWLSWLLSTTSDTHPHIPRGPGVCPSWVPKSGRARPNMFWSHCVWHGAWRTTQHGKRCKFGRYRNEEDPRCCLAHQHRRTILGVPAGTQPATDEGHRTDAPSALAGTPSGSPASIVFLHVRFSAGFWLLCRRGCLPSSRTPCPGV